MPPSLQRSEQHDQIGGTIALKRSLKGGLLLPYPHRTLTGWKAPASPAALSMFFERPPDRVVAGAIDNVQLHDRSFQHRQRPPLASFRRPEQTSAINLASAVSSKMRFLAELGECLRVRAASRPSSTNCWRVRAMVSMLVSSASAISPSLQASLPAEASAFSRMRAFRI